MGRTYLDGGSKGQQQQVMLNNAGGINEFNDRVNKSGSKDDIAWPSSNIARNVSNNSRGA